MPHLQPTKPMRRRSAGQHKINRLQNKTESRYSVALEPGLADEVERYAQTLNASMSKAIAALVRLGLESQESRKREFFRRLKENLANDDPKQQDRLIDEFRAIILGR